ncbi:MAG: NUDIX domain-containing protein [Candidatus Doudnabacteria bacterium]|nr:NUDIX domain-containing protein [Candidatus Doudnabacteria bacterium]
MPHIHEQIDFVVDVLIVYNNKVLLRLHEKHEKWLCPGGHIELDEDPNQAALREVKEETGLNVRLWPGQAFEFEGERDLIVPRFLNRHRINDHHEHVSLIFLAQAFSSDIKPDIGETQTAIRWFAEHELFDSQYEVPANIAFYARKALQELSQTI